MQHKLWFDAKTEAEWQPPKDFPDLSAAKNIAIDLETSDPALLTEGPGWAHGPGYTAGIAVSVDGWKGYYPIAHETGQNMDTEPVVRWCNDQFARENQPKIFANASYDVGWLRRTGIEIRGRWLDIQLAAPLINENERTYALNALGQRYLQEKKSESLLYEAAEMFGFDSKEAKGKIHVFSPSMVGAYAEQDADLTRRLWLVMEPLLAEQNLEEVFRLESELQPHLFEMRWRGVRFNSERAEHLQVKWEEKLKTLQEMELPGVDIWAARSIEERAKELGVGGYVRTATGEASFTTEFFESSKDKFFKDIQLARKLDKGLQFAKGLASKVNPKTGRIHAQVHQLRSDDYGTVSGRFSYSHPNLQQIPTRDPTIGVHLRNLFLPEEGQSWIGADYSSQESRVLMHYVCKRDFGCGHPLVEAYRSDPEADFHGLVADQMDIGRFKAKTLNLGMTYGMGKAKLAAQLGLSESDAELVLNNYHTQFPFIREIKRLCESRATEHGFIATLSGRRCRFDKWEPRGMRGVTALPYEEALTKWPSAKLTRGFTYKALNRLIQGSAADQNKYALLAACKAGIDVKISIHDEITASGDEQTMEALVQCMEEATDLNVPTPVTAAMGETWGDTK